MTPTCFPDFPDAAMLFTADSSAARLFLGPNTAGALLAPALDDPAAVAVLAVLCDPDPCCDPWPSAVPGVPWLAPCTVAGDSMAWPASRRLTGEMSESVWLPCGQTYSMAPQQHHNLSSTMFRMASWRGL